MQFWIEWNIWRSSEWTQSWWINSIRTSTIGRRNLLTTSTAENFRGQNRTLKAGKSMRRLRVIIMLIPFFLVCPYHLIFHQIFYSYHGEGILREDTCQYQTRLYTRNTVIKITGKLLRFFLVCPFFFIRCSAVVHLWVLLSDADATQ